MAVLSISGVGSAIDLGARDCDAVGVTVWSEFVGVGWGTGGVVEDPPQDNIARTDNTATQSPIIRKCMG